MSTFQTALLTARNSAEAMEVHTWEWFALFAIIIVLIAWDLLGHVRKPHEPTLKEAAIWSTFYIVIALLFGVLMYFRHSPEFATEYFAGYLTEKSLSLDNIFVFIIIIAAFRVPRIYQQKVVMWGIVIALVLRFAFIMLAAAIIEQFAWVFFIFGAWMLYTAIDQIKDGIEQEKDRRNPHALDPSSEYEPNALTRFVSRIFRVTDGYVGQRLVVRRGGKTWITPLMLCVISIGSIDIMFALDSIPAIYGLTQEPFIVFAANAFSLLGLRQLYFLVDGLLDRLIYLHFGLAFILGFIALKLIIHAFHGYDMLLFIPEPSPLQSTAVILSAIGMTVIVSIWGSKKWPTLNSPADAAAEIGPHEKPKPSLDPEANSSDPLKDGPGNAWK
ncbi:tellurite resistance protein TerC [Trueperella bonasi]|uniref:Tellurite resistance protein TerC n=2 Tax=Trueperella bonasi TaxID=312286 RepID=A0ABT9NDQ1_9ACTO|nr:tellurite resistance protein TerC [Trueperella bonasi]